jgi:hypothetical protein
MARTINSSRGHCLEPKVARRAGASWRCVDGQPFQAAGIQDQSTQRPFANLPHGFFFSVPLAEGSKEGNYGSLGNGSRLYLPCKHQPIACQASQINDTFLLRSPNHRHPPLLSSCPNCPSPSATQHNAGAVALRRAVSASLPRWRVVGGRRRIPRRAPCACASVQQD